MYSNPREPAEQLARHLYILPRHALTQYEAREEEAARIRSNDRALSAEHAEAIKEALMPRRLPRECGIGAGRDESAGNKCPLLVCERQEESHYSCPRSASA